MAERGRGGDELVHSAQLLRWIAAATAAVAVVLLVMAVAVDDEVAPLAARVLAGSLLPLIVLVPTTVGTWRACRAEGEVLSVAPSPVSLRVLAGRAGLVAALALAVSLLVGRSDLAIGAGFAAGFALHFVVSLLIHERFERRRGVWFYVPVRWRITLRRVQLAVLPHR